MRGLWKWRFFLFLFCFGAASLQAAKRPNSSTAATLSYEEARHLLSRTCFGVNVRQILSWTKLTREQAVERLLQQLRRPQLISPPSWSKEPYPDFASISKKPLKQRRAFQRKIQKMRVDIKLWWYRQMCQTSTPFAERMVLFWHNHFTSEMRKMWWPLWMYQQNQLFRRHLSKNFRSLLLAICKDPAMVVYLDSRNNRKGRPNENFARELLELFTLGEGNYSEADIKEAARAFTGYTLNYKKGTFYFYPKHHDWGIKKFMGRAGYFSGEDIVQILLENPRLSEFITEKLWKEFISPVPHPEEVKRLARLWRKHNYELIPYLRAFFLSKYFWLPKNRNNLVKSPVEFLVGFVRSFELPVRNPRILLHYGRMLGQDILDPPNVKGWPQGLEWINTTSLILRVQFLRTYFQLRAVEVRRVYYCNLNCPTCNRRRQKQRIEFKRRFAEQNRRILALFQLSPKPTISQIARLRKTLVPTRDISRFPTSVGALDMIYRFLLTPDYQLK